MSKKFIFALAPTAAILLLVVTVASLFVANTLAQVSPPLTPPVNVGKTTTVLNINVYCASGKNIVQHIQATGPPAAPPITVSCGGGSGVPGPAGPKGEPGQNATVIFHIANATTTAAASSSK